MKQTLLTLCLCVAFTPCAFAQQTQLPTATQNWSDTPRFVDGQQNAGAQASSPVLRSNVPMGPVNPVLLQQQMEAQQRLAQQTQDQQIQAQGSSEPNAQATQQSAQETPSDKPPVEDLTAQRLMWATDPVQNLRQEGGKIERPTPRGFSSSITASDRLRMAEWKRHLLNLGLPESKIDFEARRLNREEFELWASKLVWSEAGEHPNFIDIGR